MAVLTEPSRFGGCLVNLVGVDACRWYRLVIAGAASQTVSWEKLDNGGLRRSLVLIPFHFSGDTLGCSQCFSVSKVIIKTMKH